MSVPRVMQEERLALLPRREEMATLNIGQLDVLGYAPGGVAAVSVNIINITGVNTSLFFCFSGC